MGNVSCGGRVEMCLVDWDFNSGFNDLGEVLGLCNFERSTAVGVLHVDSEWVNLDEVVGEIIPVPENGLIGVLASLERREQMGCGMQNLPYESVYFLDYQPSKVLPNLYTGQGLQ